MSDIRFNQWLHQSGTGGVSQVASGAVGVGTTNPLADFYVRGDAQITGILTAGHIAMGSSITFGDNDRIYLGDGTDFQLYHSSSDNNSYIVESGAGSLVVNASKFHVKNAANNEDVAVFNQSGNNELYFSNSKKFETTNTGAVVTGILTATTFSGALTGNVTGTASNASGATGDFSIADKIIHTGDTNTAIRFPANDVISFERSGGEALRITTANAILTNGATSEPLYPAYTTARKVQAEIKGAIDVGQTRHHGSLAINCTNENASLHLVRSQANNTSGLDAGVIGFTVYDGTDFHQCARIMASRDAAGGDNDTPGRLTFHTTADGASSATERLRIDNVGRHGINVTNTGDYYSAADDLIIRETNGGDSGITIRTGTANSGLICFADGASSTDDQYRRGQIRYHHNNDSMDFTTAGNTAKLIITSTGQLQATSAADVRLTLGSSGTAGTNDSVHIRADSADLKFMAASVGTTIFERDGTETHRITSGGNVDINGTPPWSVSGGDYRNLSISGQTASSSGFIWLGNGAATTNADFDLGRINFCNGGTVVARVIGSCQTSANDDGRLTFHTKETGQTEAERLRITSTGKVLVGDGSSITPVKQFDVRGTGYQGILVGSTNNQGAQLIIDGIGGGDASGGNYSGFDVGTDGHLKIKNYDADKNIVLGTGSQTGANDTLTIDSDQMVTIATRNSSSGGDLGLKFGSFGIRSQDVGGYNYWHIDRNYGGWQSNMISLKADGKVGINQAVPSYQLHVNGSFAATTKSFVIDHPTKENHSLRYACLEGPENSVYVRGRSSDPVIELPEYWVGLVHDDSITVNVTPIGNKKVWVESINNNSVTIGSDDSTEYFYTVFAERKDVEKLEVEVEK